MQQRATCVTSNPITSAVEAYVHTNCPGFHPAVQKYIYSVLALVSVEQRLLLGKDSGGPEQLIASGN